MSKFRVVCNVSPIIGLATIGKLDLLWNFYLEALVIAGEESRLFE